MAKGIFITGTGTDIGKTYVTALLVKKLKEAGVKTAYYKAAVSGNVRGEHGLIPGDAAYVKEISGIVQPLGEMVPYIYEQAVSPHLAALQEGSPIELPVVTQGYEELKKKYEYITMEGSGGILCPLRCDDEEELWLEDVVKALQLPCIVIADAGLGTINATVLTIEYLKQKSIRVKGVILNHFHAGDRMEGDNRSMIEKRGGVPVISCVPDGATGIEISAEELMALYE